MTDKLELLETRLDLFDGEGVGESAGTPAAQGNHEGESAKDTGAQPETGAEVQNEQARRKAYFALINGEYKSIYETEFQKSLDKRMRAKDRETAQLQAQLQASQPVMDLLFSRYGITDGDVGKLSQALDQDNAYWEQAAEASGMSVEQYKRVQQMQMENERFRKAQEFSGRQQAMERQLAKWDTEAEALKTEYPDFDLSEEAQNEAFLALLKNGFSVKNAYESTHVEEIMERKVQETAAATEKKVTDSIRAKGGRPAENGTQQGAGFVTKIDINQTTKQDREALAKRAARGERIVL